MPIPENITDKELLNAILNINTQEPSMESSTAPNTARVQARNTAVNTNISGLESSTNNVLVVDDIGVVTYQLKVMLSNIGYNVSVAKDIFTGLNTFIKSNYAYVIMDLFVSTEQEGYTLLNETKKIITKNNLNTKIIVITASSKSEHKMKCLNGGADMFLEKEIGWQDKLVNMIANGDV